MMMMMNYCIIIIIISNYCIYNKGLLEECGKKEIVAIAVAAAAASCFKRIL